MLPNGRLLSLYVAHDGVPLTVQKIEAVRLAPMARARAQPQGRGCSCCRSRMCSPRRSTRARRRRRRGRPGFWADQKRPRAPNAGTVLPPRSTMVVGPMPSRWNDAVSTFTFGRRFSRCGVVARSMMPSVSGAMNGVDGHDRAAVRAPVDRAAERKRAPSEARPQETHAPVADHEARNARREGHDRAHRIEGRQCVAAAAAFEEGAITDAVLGDVHEVRRASRHRAEAEHEARRDERALARRIRGVPGLCARKIEAEGYAG